MCSGKYFNAGVPQGLKKYSESSVAGKRLRKAGLCFEQQEVLSARISANVVLPALLCLVTSLIHLLMSQQVLLPPPLHHPLENNP